MSVRGYDPIVHARIAVGGYRPRPLSPEAERVLGRRKQRNILLAYVNVGVDRLRIIDRKIIENFV